MTVEWEKYHPYFEKREFDCKATGENAMWPLFMEALLAIRLELNKPIKINSGYRSAKHPEELKKNSKTKGPHVLGAAVDVSCRDKDGKVDKQYQNDLMAVAKNHGITRFGIAPGWLHLDMADKHSPENFNARRTWTYTK